MSPFSQLRILPAIVLAAVCGLAGCHHASVSQPLTASAVTADNRVEAQFEFWHTLENRPVTCNDEAFHGLLLFANRQDPAKDYVGRVAVLKEKGMLPPDFDRPANEAVERGTLAVAIVKALNLPGGVMMKVTGNTPRYAVREVQYRGIFPTSSPQQTFSGAQFVGIIGRMEDYQSINRSVLEGTPLPNEKTSAQTGQK